MRATPKTEAELQAAIDGGLLVEDHHTDLKRELAPGKTANRNLAADIASMAVDGGWLIIGVAEDKVTGTFSLTPFPLTGMKERIDRVAQDVPQPSVNVRIHTIPATQTDGYLIIEVPASLDAPHMVDGKYRGRGDTTNIVLSDADVTRLHTIRNGRANKVSEMLDFEIDRDPWRGVSERRNAHLHVVALPIRGHTEMLDIALDGDHLRWRDELLNQHTIETLMNNVGHGDYRPRFHGLCQPRARGFALCDDLLGNGRSLSASPVESRCVDLEIWEDGSVHAFNARASDEYTDGFRLIPNLIKGFILDTIAVTRGVADLADYRGGWELGVAITNLRHLRPVADARHAHETSP